MKAADPMDRCGADTRKRLPDGSPKPCGNKAGKRTGHPGVGRCWLHGGASPQAELSGQIVLARREAAVMGIALDIDPHEAILECIRICAGEVRFASERIAELGQEDAVGPVMTQKIRRYERKAEASDDVEKSEQDDLDEEAELELVEVEEVRYGPPAVHIWIEVRHRAMDQLVAFSATAERCGIAKHLVRVAEQQGQMLARAIAGILRDLDVDKRPEAPQIVRKHLALVYSAAA